MTGLTHHFFLRIAVHKLEDLVGDPILLSHVAGIFTLHIRNVLVSLFIKQEFDLIQEVALDAQMESSVAVSVHVIDVCTS